MPELPEVEIQRRHLEAATAGAVVARLERPDTARFEGDPEDLCGQRITAWRRRGKYLIAECGPWRMLSHLGMTGQWIVDAAPGRAHARVILSMDNGHSITLIDPRRFGWTWILPTEELADHPRLASL